jgi:hypothetical protein
MAQSVWRRASARRPGFDSRQGQEIFLFSAAFVPSLGPVQPPIQWVPGPLPAVKRPGSKADHSLPSFAEVKNIGVKPYLKSYTSFEACD